MLVPAWGSPARNGTVHDVVSDEEEGLEPLYLPAEYRSVKELLLRKGPALEDLNALDDTEAARHFPPGHCGLEALGVVGGKLLFEVVGEAWEALEVPDQLRLELIEYLEEGGLVGGGHDEVIGQIYWVVWGMAVSSCIGRSVDWNVKCRYSNGSLSSRILSREKTACTAMT